jgi:4-nitrophenyl phosphatase
VIRGLILDLDGTVYRGDHAVPGAAAFVADTAARGVRSLFVTNRANRPTREVCAQLRGMGIDCTEADIMTSAEATAAFVATGSAYVIGEAGMFEALAKQGITIDDARPDAVIVSYDRDFDYAKLKRACELIHAGARFVASNPDACLRTDEGIHPGTGAIVAAVAAGSGVAPIVIGKPRRALFDQAVAAMKLPPGEVVVIGDSVDTDIAAAANAGLRSVLLLTGVSTRADAARAAHAPTWIAEDYDALAEIIQAEDVGAM